MRQCDDCMCVGTLRGSWGFLVERMRLSARARPQSFCAKHQDAAAVHSSIQLVIPGSETMSNLNNLRVIHDLRSLSTNSWDDDSYDGSKMEVCDDDSKVGWLVRSFVRSSVVGFT